VYVVVLLWLSFVVHMHGGVAVVHVVVIGVCVVIVGSVGAVSGWLLHLHRCCVIVSYTVVSVVVDARCCAVGLFVVYTAATVCGISAVGDVCVACVMCCLYLGVVTVGVVGCCIVTVVVVVVNTATVYCYLSRRFMLRVLLLLLYLLSLLI